MSTRLQEVLRVGQARASATGASLPKRQPVSTAVNGEDSDEDWPPLPDWAWNLAPLDQELGEYYMERCEKEVKRLMKLLRETRETRDQAALMAEAAERSANTLEQKLKRQVESSKESDTALRESTRMRLKEKEELIKEKEKQLRQLQAALEKAQKEAEEREKAWATKFAELGKRVEDAQTAAAKGAEAASSARNKMELEQKQVHAMIEALAVEAQKRADSEEEVAENMKKFANSQEELADCKEALVRCLKRSEILEKLVQNQKETLADKDAQTAGAAILEQLVQKQKEVIADMGARMEILEKRAQMENTEADEEEHDEDLPELEPATPPESPPGSPPADPNVETKPENPAQSDTYDAPFSEESVRKVAIEQIEKKLDAITKNWPPRGKRTDKELRVQLTNYAAMHKFLMDDLKALNDTRNYALSVLTARIGHAYLKHITPLAFQASKFWEKEMAKRVRVAFFGMRYKPDWAETFSAFANIAKKKAPEFATGFFVIEEYVSKKKPGFKAFAKTGNLSQPLKDMLDMVRKLSTEKPIQYFASNKYDKTNHQENVYKMCEALPLFVKMLAWLQDAKLVFRKVNDSNQQPNIQPDMYETFLKLDKSLNALAHSVVAVQTIMTDPDLPANEQIVECFAYLEADDWVPIMKNRFFEGVRYNFDAVDYWSRKSGPL